MAAGLYRSIRSLDEVRAFQTASLVFRQVLSLSRYATELDVVHLVHLGGASGQQEAEIGASRDIARPHAHEFGREVGPRRQAANADMLAMLAARGNGPGIGIAQARMLVLAGKAPIGEEISRADHHQVDALDRGDVIGSAQRFFAFKLDD